MGYITPSGKCKHCGVPISYHSDDASYIHDECAWGSKDIMAKDYNNRYWCTAEMKTRAEPIKPFRLRKRRLTT